MNNWIMAIRPQTLTASIAPVLLALTYSYVVFQKFTLITSLLILSCSLLLQIGSNLVNDYYDAKSGVDDYKRLGPKRVTQSRIIPGKQVKLGFVLCFILSFILGLYLMTIGGRPIIIIGISAIVIAFMYTGGPLPLSHYALGEFLALLFFGVIAVYGTVHLQGLELREDIIILGLGPGFAAATLMAINNLRDRESDKDHGKITLATLLSPEMARFNPFFFASLSAIIPIYFSLEYTFTLLGVVPYFIFLPVWLDLFLAPIDEHLNESLKRTGQYLFFYCLTISIGFLIELY
jgi:1,4-dihydroxy-2-naphthoate octaprenyltransferase